MRDVAYIALGSNLGVRERHLSFGVAEISRLPSTTLLKATEPEETEPFGPPGQGKYLNQMIVIETALSPHQLLAALQEIEARSGRTRALRWGPRTLDLDIVKFGRQKVSDAALVIPHPGLRDRAFWRTELQALGGAVDD